MYCNSRILEEHWFHWLVSSATPQLESYRKVGTLWTKVLGTVQPPGSRRSYPNPSHPVRAHCLAVADPYYFNSYAGALPDGPTRFEGCRPRICAWPEVADTLDPDVVRHLLKQGYFPERATDVSWHHMQLDIHRICTGVVSKFNIPCASTKEDVASEAFAQVVAKIKEKRLVYTPGRAPVFNLLTTAVHRCVFSVLNKDSRYRRGLVPIETDIGVGARGQLVH